MATQNKLKKWYSPKRLADLADDGFLATVRSTGAVVRAIEIGGSKTISVVAKPWRKKKNGPTVNTDSDLKPGKPDLTCEEAMPNDFRKSASSPAAQSQVGQFPAEEIPVEQREQEMQQRLVLLIDLATEAAKARLQDVGAPPLAQDREKDLEAAPPDQEREREQEETTPDQEPEPERQESKPEQNRELSEQSPEESDKTADAESAEPQTATPPRPFQETIQPEKKEKRQKQVIDIDALLASQPQRDRVAALKLRVAVIEFFQGHKETAINAQRDLIAMGLNAEPFFVAALQKDNPVTVDLALEGLASLNSKLFMPCLAELFSSPVLDVRLMALRSLRRLNDEDAKPFFSLAARDPSPEVRMRAVSCLTWRGALWAVELVLELCNDPAPLVKWAAIEAMVDSQPEMARDLVDRSPPAAGDGVYRRRIEMLFEKTAIKTEEKMLQAQKEARRAQREASRAKDNLDQAEAETGQAKKKVGQAKRETREGKKPE